MNSAKWTWFAIGYQCLFAYAISLIVYQLGMLFTGSGSVIGTIVAAIIIAFMIYMLVKPYKEDNSLKVNVKTSKKKEKETVTK